MASRTFLTDEAIARLERGEVVPQMRTDWFFTTLDDMPAIAVRMNDLAYNGIGEFLADVAATSPRHTNTAKLLLDTWNAGLKVAYEANNE